MPKHKHVINQEELDWIRSAKNGRFGVDRKQLGSAARGKELGCSLIKLAPGKRAWPFHYHYGNEEAIYILEGSASLRLGGATVAVGTGDYIAMPAGPEGGHQLYNDSQKDVTYLCISTMKAPDVVAYPDSGKIGAIAGSAPGGSPEQRLLTEFFRAEDAVDYWQGEDESRDDPGR